MAKELNTKGELVTKATREHCITGLRGKPFSKRGDSGAFVADKDGAMIRLLFGGSQEKNDSYFMHSSDLIAHIKRSRAPKQ